MSQWETQLLDLIGKDGIELIEDAPSIYGTKYSISPAIPFEDMRGRGSPVGENASKGWIIPEDESGVLENLKRYVCTKLDVTYEEDKQTSLSMFNNNYSHSICACYSMCENVFKKANIPNIQPLCLRTWVFPNIHKTEGKFNRNVCSHPWYKMRTYNNLKLSNLTGRISAVFIPKDNPSKIKFWCNVSYGEVEQRICNEKFTEEDFMKLI